jgi:hypothetical protein
LLRLHIGAPVKETLQACISTLVEHGEMSKYGLGRTLAPEPVKALGGSKWAERTHLRLVIHGSSCPVADKRDRRSSLRDAIAQLNAEASPPDLKR